MQALSQLLDKIQNIELYLSWLCGCLGITTAVAWSWFLLFFIGCFCFFLSQILIVISDLRR